ncbi:MAG: hypothetical protein VR72_18065 [Clostridiaceae bacterium BRH_c20a]|nr:MAG: hypothetical protein VR72_18065 [Clostridiaceae bacterium BRH_c20a]
MIKIGVKFCGNCNPDIDTKKLFLNLRNGLKESIEFVYWEQDAYEILLVLNGCNVACAEHPIFMGTSIIIAGETLDYVSIIEEDLLLEIERKIEKLK